jgi:hypothetical protein
MTAIDDPQLRAVLGARWGDYAGDRLLEID